VPTAVDEADDNGTCRKSYQQRNVWRRSGTRSVDTGAEVAESAAAIVDQRHIVEERPNSRRSRFHPRNTESADNLDVDQALSLLDQMNFKPSKKKVVGSDSGLAAADVESGPSVDAVGVVASSESSVQMPSVKGTHTVSLCSGNCIGVSGHEAEAALDDGNWVLSPVQSVGNDNLVTGALRARSSAVTHIPRTVLAWTSPSNETCTTGAVPTDPDNSTSAEHLHSSPVETSEYESSGETKSDQASGQDNVFKHFSQTVANSSPTSIIASASSTSFPTNSNRQPDDRGAKSKLLQEVVGSSQSAPVCHVPRHYPSPGGVATPRLLSADASYYLEQEEGDVIIESSSEEDFDD